MCRKCAYCGLSNRRPGDYGEKSFIRVTWPTYSLNEIIERISERLDRVKRICISMITHKRAINDTKEICARLRSSFDVPVSLLIAPTILNKNDLLDFRSAGADKVGVAIDLATPVCLTNSGDQEWGDLTNGKSIGNVLRTLWNFSATATRALTSWWGWGKRKKRCARRFKGPGIWGGGHTFFPFFPEAESRMADHKMPPMEQYRRIQVARYLIDHRLSAESRFTWNNEDQISEFGLSPEALEEVIQSGEPFRTSGCSGYDGQVACNRPYANSRPGPDIRNYPFPPDENDLPRIKMQMG